MTSVSLGGRRVLVSRPNTRQYGHLGLEILMSLAHARDVGADLFFIRPAVVPGGALFELDANEVRIVRPHALMQWWLRRRVGLTELGERLRERRGEALESFRTQMIYELQRQLSPRYPHAMHLQIKRVMRQVRGDVQVEEQRQQQSSYFQRRLLRNPVAVRLRPEVSNRARDLAAQCGVPLDVPLVTVHARESGYKQGQEMQDTKPGGRDDTTRNARIESYFDAIDFLVERGYTVVRVGDPTMTPVQRPGVVDLATSPHRNSLVDVYCLLNSHFMLAGESGLLGVSYLTNTPLLLMNCTEPISAYPIRPEGMFGMKKVILKKSGRPLKLADMLTHNYQEYLRNVQQYTYIDNTGEEILEAVKEMLEWLGGARSESPGQRAVRALMIERAAAMQIKSKYVRKWGLDVDFLGDGRMVRFQADAQS